MNSITTLLILYLTSVTAEYTQSWVMDKNLPYKIYPQDILFDSQNNMINIAFYETLFNQKEWGILFSKTDLNGNLQPITQISDLNGLKSASGIIDKNDNIFLLIWFSFQNSRENFYSIRKFKEEDGNIIYDDSITHTYTIGSTTGIGLSVTCCGEIYYLDEYIYYTYTKAIGSSNNIKAISVKYDLNLNKVSDFEIAEVSSGYVIKYHIKDMKIDYDGNLIVAGTRYDGSQTNNDNYWILKISNNNAEWLIIENDGNNDEVVNFLLIDSDNNIYLSGKTKSKLYGNGNNIDIGWYNGFLAKYDTDGNFIFGKQSEGQKGCWIACWIDNIELNDDKSEIIMLANYNSEQKKFINRYNLDGECLNMESYVNDIPDDYINRYYYKEDLYYTFSNDLNLVNMKYIKFYNPANNPTNSPTKTKKPTSRPTTYPTKKPTNSHTKKPTNSPTKKPTISPTKNPIPRPPPRLPTTNPTIEPSFITTYNPTKKPTPRPTNVKSLHPVSVPTLPSENITFNYICKINYIEDKDISQSTSNILTINIEKSLLSSHFEINLMKKNKIVSIIDDDSIDNIPNFIFWALPHIKSDYYYVHMISKNDNIIVNECNTNAFKIINKEYVDEASITFTHILLIVIIALLSCICLGIFYGLKLMKMKANSQEAVEALAVEGGIENPQETKVEEVAITDASVAKLK